MLKRSFTKVGPLLSGKMPMRAAKVLGMGDAHADPSAWWAPAKVGRCSHFKTAAEQALVTFEYGFKWIAGVEADTRVWELMCWARYMHCRWDSALLWEAAVLLCYRAHPEEEWVPCTDVDSEVLRLPMAKGARAFKASIVRGPAWVEWWDRMMQGRS